MKKSQLTKAIYFLLILCLALSTNACRKKKDAIPDPNELDKSGKVNKRIAGVVKDTDGNPVSGVLVTANGQTAYTGNFGEFTIEKVRVADRIYVKAEHSGYFTGTATEAVAEGGTQNVQLLLAEKVVVATLDASSGGTAQDTEGSEVVIPANGIITSDGSAYSGNVSVSMLHLDPNSIEFGLLTQGADMQAQNTSGTSGSLYSYGVLKVELNADDGTELQLASGSSAAVTMTIPASQLATAPATIPLWYFDETTGVWVEEGTASKVGDKYIGTVTHFTDWNCDVFSDSQAILKGKVVDCSGKPIPFVFVQTGQSIAYTDENGVFTRRVPSGVAFDVTMETGYFQTFTSSMVIGIPALSAGQEYDAGTLTIDQCIQTIEGSIVGCLGQKVPGYIVSNNTWLGFTEDGNFSIIADLSSPMTLTVYDYYWGFASVTVPSSAASVNSVGDVLVCTETTPVGENSYVIDGDGYNNRSIVLQIPNDPNYNYYTYAEMGVYTDSSNQEFESLWLSASGLINNGVNEQYTWVDLGIQNQSTPIGLGSYAFAYDSVYNSTYAYGYIYLEDMNNSSGNDGNYNAVSGTLTITRMDAVGGLIEGTFSGVFQESGTWDSTYYNYTPGPTVNITNGKFSMLRYPDYNYNYRPQRSALRDKVMADKQRHRRRN